MATNRGGTGIEQHRNPSPHREQDRFDPGGLTRLLGHGGGRLHRRGRVDDYGCGPSPTTPEATTTAAPTTTIADACRDTFCVRYNIRPEAAWADGTPVTAEDFVFTYETIVDPSSLEIVSREGYQLITGYEVVDDKTVVFAFDEIYAPWQTLFSLSSQLTSWRESRSTLSGTMRSRWARAVHLRRMGAPRSGSRWRETRITGVSLGRRTNPQCRVPRRRGGAGGCPGRR